MDWTRRRAEANFGRIIMNKLPPVEVLEELLSYDPETGELRWRVTRGGGRNAARQGAIAGCAYADGRIYVRLNGSKYISYRLAWKLFYKEEPPPIMDHIDGDPTNNKILNLRAASGFENAANRRKLTSSSTGIKGLCWQARYSGYHASITQEDIRSRKWFGVSAYGSKEAAFEAAKKWIQDKRQELHGEFARD